MVKFNKIKSSFFEKINKINKVLIKLGEKEENKQTSEWMWGNNSDTVDILKNSTLELIC